jgi:hypothetical protein
MQNTRIQRQNLKIWFRESRVLTAAVEIQLHESNWAVDPVVEGIFLAKGADPGKVRGWKMLLEEREAMLQDGGRVVSVEVEKGGDYVLALLVGEK